MLIDSCVVIDILRGHAAATTFIAALTTMPALSVVTVLELRSGVRNAKEKRHLMQVLSGFMFLDVDLNIANLAGDYLRRYRPSHGVGSIDALTAATAANHALPLATLNLKHFPMFAGLKRPYMP